MSDAEAIAWCVEHEAQVEFRYVGHTYSGHGQGPSVIIRVDERVRYDGVTGLVSIKYEAVTFPEAVSGAKAQFDLAAARKG